MSDSSSTSKVILALLAGASIGAVIGAGAALLLSPNDGKTNRKKLKEKINTITEDMHDRADQLIDDIQEELDNFSNQEAEPSMPNPVHTPVDDNSQTGPDKDTKISTDKKAE